MTASVAPAARVPAADAAPEAALAAADEACLNCGAPLAGPYCAQCGQRALPPRPTMRELVREVWDEAVSLDGRFVTTMRLLLTRPGRLTTETLAGRRARYLGPVRLYLLCSVAYFFASAALPEQSARQRRAEARRTVAAQTGVALPKSCRSDDEPVPGWVRRLRAADCRTDREPERFQALRRANMPRLLFVLLPLYAGLVALFFRGHTYPEHLVFALHLHAFTFLAALGERAADLLPSKRADGVIDAVLWLVVVVYALVALRRVYGRPWLATLARGFVLGTVYGAIFLTGLIGLVVVTALVM